MWVTDLQPAPLVEYGGERREWHALFCAKGKLYSYRLHLGAFQDPLSRQIRYHEQRAVNLTLLREAAGLFEGGHDFAAFANNPRDKVRMYCVYPSIYLLMDTYVSIDLSTLCDVCQQSAG